jgi:hypothetical protein
MNPRQPDGTFRGPKQPARLSESYLRARWVEAEALALRKKWLSYEDIATHITRVGRGQEDAVKPIPEGVVFGESYSITKQAVQKTVSKALQREPALDLEEFRQLAVAQSEASLKFLQSAIRDGDPHAISTSTKVLAFVAKLKGAWPAADHSAAAKQKASAPQPLVELLAEIDLLDEESGIKKAG